MTTPSNTSMNEEILREQLHYIKTHSTYDKFCDMCGSLLIKFVTQKLDDEELRGLIAILLTNVHILYHQHKLKAEASGKPDPGLTEQERKEQEVMLRHGWDWYNKMDASARKFFQEGCEFKPVQEESHACSSPLSEK